MADTGTIGSETSEAVPEKYEPANIIATLELLTSSMPSVENSTENTNVSTAKSKSRRGRKKRKTPVKVSQPNILPKVFAIQIAPQTNIVAPASAGGTQGILQRMTNTAVGPIAHQTQMASIEHDVNLKGKADEERKLQQIRWQESIQLAGTFQYATNNSEPARFDSSELTIGSHGFQKVDQKRLVHNASEKRRKEKINAWIAKIATVLFKHYPEKQRKIYILEKAYDFIVERTRPLEGSKGKQDAFTQAATAQGETLSDLIGKVIELENLLQSLLNVIQKYKIPAPQSLLRSPYIKDFVSTRLSSDSCAELTTPASTSVSNTIHWPVTANGDSSLINGPNHSRIPSQAMVVSRSNPNIKANRSVSQAHLEISSDLANRGLQSLVDCPINCKTATPVSQSHVATDSNSDSSRGLSIAEKGSLRAANETTIVAHDHSVAMQKNVPLDLQATPMANPADALSLQNASNGTTAADSNSLNVIVSTTNNLVNSVPQNIIRAMVDLPSGSFNDAVSSSYRRDTVINGANAVTSNIVMSQAHLIRETANKVPSMASQMFVMKNLVNSRNRANMSSGSSILPISTNDSCVLTIATNDRNSEKQNSNLTRNTVPQLHVRNAEGNSSSDGTTLPEQTTVQTSQMSKTNMGLTINKTLETEAVLRSVSVEEPFVRGPTQVPVSSQAAQQALSIERRTLGSNGRCLDVSTNCDTGNGSESVKRPSKPSKLPLASIAVKNPNMGAPLQQTRTASGLQIGSASIQTCHSVTSLLSNMTTSPTDNTTLSIESIRAGKAGCRQESNATWNSKQTAQKFSRNVENKATSRADVGPRKRSSSNRVTRKQSNARISNILQVSCSQSPINAAKPSPKRAKKNASQQSSKSGINAPVNGPSSQQTFSANASKALSQEGAKKAQQQRKQTSNRSCAGLNVPLGESTMTLPKPHNFVSLARKEQRNKNTSNTLGQFSTESLLRNNNAGNCTQGFVGEVEQDISLPTILNIFAPAATIGNMVNQIPLSNNLPNAQHISNNSTFPTIQSTFSNFSAETLIGGQVESQTSVHAVMNSAPNANENNLVQSEQQNLFTDFSTDALLAGTESNLSYGIDNIMSRNDVVASNSCVSPNWLQTNSFIDSSPVRGSFNQGFNIFDTPINMQGYVSTVTNGGFTTPVKWRQDLGRLDEQNISSTPSSSGTVLGIWGQSSVTPLKAPQAGPNRNLHKSKGATGQPNSKRGPSFGDFLLVDSVS